MMRALRSARAACGATLLVVLLTVQAPDAFAESNDVASNAEWRAWPEYCRARYVAYNAGKMNPIWERQVSRASIQKWAGIIAMPMWDAMHHYCRGLVRLHRYKNVPKASAAAMQATRKYEADAAVEEFRYVLNYKKDNPRFSPIIEASLALALHYSGRSTEAMYTIGQAIHDQPDIVDPYSAGYIILREAGKRDDGLELLKKCHEATKGSSAENNYFLALEYLDRKDYDNARDYAKQAYKLGYPLQGAKRRLMAAGKW